MALMCNKAQYTARSGRSLSLGKPIYSPPRINKAASTLMDAII